MQPFKSDDDEDFNIFVSPGRFSGQTPNAATARSRIFQDANALDEAYKQHEIEQIKKKSGPKGTATGKAAPASKRLQQKPFFCDEEMGVGGGAAPAPKGIAQQARIRSTISCANCVAAMLGLVLVAVAMFVAAGQRDAAVRALLFTTAPALRSPLYMGIALFVGGVAMVLFGAGVGVGALAEGLSSGLVTQAHRLSLILYQILVFIALAACTTSLIASVGTLFAVQGSSSVTRSIWTTLPPHVLCRYEQAHRCAGRVPAACRPVPGPANAISDCPGVFCNKFCHPKNNSAVDCAPCRTLIVRGLLHRCVTHELKTSKLNECSTGIVQRVRILMVTDLAASFTGIITSLTVGIVDLVVSSP